MPVPYEQLRRELLNLPPATRAQLLKELRASLDPSDPATRHHALAPSGDTGVLPPGCARDLRLPDVLGIGAGWGAGWALIGLTLALGLKLFRPGDFDPGEALGQIVGVLSLLGFTTGLAFVGLLAFLEGRRPLRDVPLPRVALWGLLAAAGLPWLSGADPAVGILTGLLGAGFASLSVKQAQRRLLQVPQGTVAHEARDPAAG